MAERLVYKIRLDFENDETGQPAHPQMIVAVTKTGRNGFTPTLEAAVEHCRKNLHHRTEDGTVYKVVKAEPVTAEAVPESQAPKLYSMEQVTREQGMAPPPAAP